MAVIQVGNQTSGCRLEFNGESTDIKPILKECNSDSTFFEIDTKQVYVWHIDVWRKIT
jgi:hypothetical protein